MVHAAVPVPKASLAGQATRLTALRQLRQVGEWQAVLALLREAKEVEVSPDIISYNLAMEALVSLG